MRTLILKMTSELSIRMDISGTESNSESQVTEIRDAWVAPLSAHQGTATLSRQPCHRIVLEMADEAEVLPSLGGAPAWHLLFSDRRGTVPVDAGHRPWPLFFSRASRD
jgi:hypothetical protein